MKKNHFLVVIYVIALALASCNNQKTPTKTDILYSFYDSILGLPSGSYSLELPATDATLWTNRPWNTKNVFLVRSNNQIKPDRLIVVDGEVLDVSSFKEVMTEWRLYHFESDRFYLSCRLNIDKSLKMKDVDEIRQVLVDLGCIGFQYAAVPKNGEIDICDYFSWSCHRTWAPTRLRSDSIYLEYLNRSNEIPNQINVKWTGLNTYEINGVSVKGEACKPVLKDLIQKDLDYLILFQMDAEMPYGDYMSIITMTWEIVEELREEYAMEKYSKHLDQVFNDEELEEIESCFPFRYFEVRE